MSKTIKRTIIVSSTIALLLLFLVGNNVFANTFSGKYTTGNLTWKFAGSYSSDTQKELLKYPKKWTALSSKLNLKGEGDSYKYSRFRIRYNLTKPSTSGLLGRTFFFTKEGSPLTYTDKWWKATVSVYKNPDANTTNKHATLVHEAGHAFSMAHCNHPGKKHIMHQGLKNYTSVSTYEKNELIGKWGS